MNTHDHYRVGERIRSNISTYDGAVRLTGPLETVNEQEESRVFVVVSAPAGDDPEATAQELALTVQKAAPGADVYTSTTTKEK